MNMNMKTVLIIVIIILIGSLSFAFGYMYLSEPKNSNNTINQTSINQTVQNGTTIPYSSEYITFNKAKSIAKNNAAKGVTVSDPILIKDKAGRAIYVIYYSYDGYSVGGIIINAKTGAVLYRELNIPSVSNTDTSNNYDQNYDNSYYDNSNYDNSNYDDSNNDNSNYDDSNNNDQNYDDSNYDDSNNNDQNYDDSYYDNSNYDDSNY